MRTQSPVSPEPRVTPPPLAEAASRPEPVFDTIETAAAKLAVAPNALRARCRKAAKRAGDAEVARLGGGIVAFRFGGSWRIRFPRF